MKWGILLIAMLRAFSCFAQGTQPAANGTIEGIIFDHDTKDRVARTIILNINTKKFWYNNLKGEFKVDAVPGDKLVFSKQDYLPDTVLIKDAWPAPSLLCTCNEQPQYLHEVTI